MNKFYTLIYISFIVIVLTIRVDALIELKQDKNISSNENTSLIENILKLDDQKPVPKRLNTVNNNSLLTSSDSDSETTIDYSANTVKYKNKSKGSIKVKIPVDNTKNSAVVISNRLVNSDVSKKYDIVTEIVDGGFRHIINIRDASAPEKYNFDIELMNDKKLILNKDGTAKVESPVSNLEKFKDKNLLKDYLKNPQNPRTFTKLIVAKPWAKDANGKSLKTYYLVNGNTLSQIIEHKDAKYPVLADPAWCGKATSSMTWKKFNYPDQPANGVSLVIQTTWCGRLVYSPSIVYIPGFWYWFGGWKYQEESFSDPYGLWNEVMFDSPYSSTWPRWWDINDKTTKSIRNQLYCHSFGWTVKTIKEMILKEGDGSVWRLESWRPYKEWYSLTYPNPITKSCNN